MPSTGAGFTVGEGVERAATCGTYERQAGDPLVRPLRVFALDPSAGCLNGAVATIAVLFEPVAEGFRGHVFAIDPRDGGCGITYDLLALDDRAVLLASGRKPSSSDPLFHQQMVYAVCMSTYAAFRTALGRHLAWGFENGDEGDGRTRLRLRPWAFDDAFNAFYDKSKGELSFGYRRAAPEGSGPAPPNGPVFACLSHDVVVHEVTHALLDGLRSHFSCPSGPDVLAFHEGFADVVALLQRFSYPKVVEAAIGTTQGSLERASLLTEIASEFGWVLGGPRGRGLRSAIDSTGALVYDADLRAHELGSVLVSAVFDTFVAIYDRKIRRFLRIATMGTGRLPPGDMPSELCRLLAEEASKLARQFLTICIRALDYCPPVDIELGEFLRAVLTADHELVPDDPWAYRETWIDSFRKRHIFPRGAPFLAEDALLWEPPVPALAPIGRLSFAELKFDGDPARPASARELHAQASALGRFVSAAEHVDAFGLALPGDSRLGGDRVEMPCVQSIRSSRRVGPDGQVLFDLVAEVTQTRHVQATTDLPPFDFVGGATIIIGPDGRVRFVVLKSVLTDERLARQRRFLAGRGNDLWKLSPDGRLEPGKQPFRLVHQMEERHG